MSDAAYPFNSEGLDWTGFPEDRLSVIRAGATRLARRELGERPGIAAYRRNRENG